MRVFAVVGMVVGMLMFSPAQLMAEDNLKETVKQVLKQKVRRTGTLDLYDVKIDAVRNLRMIDIDGDVKESGAVLSSKVNFRDINSGDVVTLGVKIEKAQRDYKITDIEVVSVAAIDTGADPDKVYQDKEIQNVMRAYLEKQAEFTGAVMLFDEKKGKMRNLKLDSIDQEVRRLGNNYISTALFKDADTSEDIKIDITVKNDQGNLNVKRMRIRKIK